MAEQFAKTSIQMIEELCKCSVSNLNTTEQMNGFGRYIGSKRDDPVYITHSMSGLKVGYYMEGVCRYWKLHAFNDQYDEIIAYYND
jgi:hypothetical protein